MDDPKTAPEDDAVMQQRYPSPMVDAADAQYYAQLAQHRELESAQSEHRGQHEQPEDHDLHRLQESSPQQQSPRPSVSADELQLAAQLTQGLAPMIAAAAAQEQAQAQHSMAQQDGRDGQGQPQPEQNLQEQLEASLQTHEQQEMQPHEHELQDHDHHELQDVQQAHHYAQGHPPPAHLPHHMLEHLPNVHSQYPMADTTPPRKRSKVSRACDECRRKKIKCDVQSDTDDQPCSNCRRSNAQCLFSRVPQKRGPSKG